MEYVYNLFLDVGDFGPVLVGSFKKKEETMSELEGSDCWGYVAKMKMGELHLEEDEDYAESVKLTEPESTFEI